MKKFNKKLLTIIATSVIFGTVSYGASTNNAIKINAKSNNKKVHNHKYKKNKHHVSYSKQMRNDVNNYNRAMIYTANYFAYKVGDDGDNKYTNDYDGIVDSIGNLISYNDSLSPNYIYSLPDNRDDAVSIYNSFSKRFSKKENKKLNHMRHQVSGKFDYDNSYKLKNNVSIFLRELSKDIYKLKK